jgi:hypothetical protein
VNPWLLSYKTYGYQGIYPHLTDLYRGESAEAWNEHVQYPALIRVNASLLTRHQAPLFTASDYMECWIFPDILFVQKSKMEESRITLQNAM